MRSRLAYLATTLFLAMTACAPQSAAPAPTTALPPPTAAPPKPTTAPQPAAAPTTAPQPVAPKTAATTAPAAVPAQTTPGPEWDALVQLAKQEGQLVIFEGRASSRQLQDAFPAFEQKFGIKVTPVAGSGDENADKVLAERSTGIFSGDIWMGGLTIRRWCPTTRISSIRMR
jgi:hypothetical protein